jgi:hypothetical protein
MAETWVQYNGVKLRNVLTRSFVQEAVYDQSNTDLLYYKFAISVVGYLAAGEAEEVGGVVRPRVGTLPDGYGSATEQHSAIRSLLGEPRKAFLMTTGNADDGTGGATLLLAAPMGARTVSPTARDLNNGPKPKRVSVTQVAGSSLMEIEFQIDICMLECDGETSAPDNTSGILSNRWSVTDTIDHNFMTTRVIRGRLRTVNGNLNPNAVRHWVVPRLQEGFRRDSMRFNVTEDALNLEYTITDLEIAFSPPRPATEWHYRYSEEAHDAKVIQSSIDLMLGGDRNVDKTALVRIAIAIIKNKLFGGNLTAKKALLRSLKITDEYGDRTNRVHVQCRVQRVKGGPTDRDLVGIAAREIGTPITRDDLLGVVPALPPDYDRNKSRSGYAGEVIENRGPIPIVAAWHAYLQNPCNDFHEIQSVEIGKDDGEDDYAKDDGKLDATIVTRLDGDPVDYVSSDHQEAIYTHYKLESAYKQKRNRLQLPISGQVALLSAGTPTSRIVGIGLPTWQRRIKIVAERIGDSPVVAEPRESYAFGPGGAAVLVHSIITPQTPERTADGKLLHRVSAEYLYALTTPPPTAGTPLPIGVNPWEDPAFATHSTESALLTGDPA